MAKNLSDSGEAATAARIKHSNGNGHGKTKGLRFGRFFTPPGSHAYDLVEWERRTAAITGEKGQVIFEQKDVEVPRSWSQLAINVVAQKYFRGSLGSPERETSVRQIIDRVVDTIADWGRQGGYFATEEDAANWAEELRFLLVTQHASFNSPVWFNIGIPSRSQQASACFINSVQDSMESILDLAKTEGMLFKFGSGTGTNLSVLRSSREQLSGGGTASGPVSFMKGYDSFAGSIKSGGTTRRAAKMVILNADHPDVMDFIRCKAVEEKKAWALIEAGYNVGFNVPGGAYDSVQFQNANHSVRVSDDYMRAVIDDKEWKTKAVVDGRTVDTYKARDLWREIADAAWICGDPGLQFDSTIQEWNVVPNTGRINATNPCSEFVFLDDTACNLLSLNLMKFQTEQGTFDVERFQRAVDVTFTGQEILVSNASYPTQVIAKNSEALRPLGLGYANLGALLMSMGLAYDSDEGRRFAGAITAIMTGRAFAQSARMAQVKGPFSEYAKNREPMLRVMEKHRQAAYALSTSPESADVVKAARDTWDDAVNLGHIRMMAGVQPFISGSMSKTVNLPSEATVEDIEQTYMESWKLGLKCIAIYRDGCKRSQPLSTSLDKEKKAVTAAAVETDYKAVRHKLPDERKAVTHKFDIAGHEGYLTVGLYEDGSPGELFVTMAKEGSTISGLMDAFATQTSYALQFGVPLKFMVDKFSHMRFEPSGFTKNPEIPIAKSIVDYIFRWMAAHFLPAEDAEEAGVIRREPAVEIPPPPTTPDPQTGPGALKVIAAPPANGVQKIAFIN